MSDLDEALQNLKDTRQEVRKLTIMALRPDNRKRDLGNLLEATEDLLKSVGVIEDDSLSEMICLRWVTNGSPFTVRVEPAGVA